jgi:hypothetical protein
MLSSGGRQDEAGTGQAQVLTEKDCKRAGLAAGEGLGAQVEFDRSTAALDLGKRIEQLSAAFFHQAAAGRGDAMGGPFTAAHLQPLGNLTLETNGLGGGDLLLVAGPQGHDSELQGSDPPLPAPHPVSEIAKAQL